MLKKTIQYKDFLDNDRSKTLYFHISTADAIRMMMSESDIDTENLPEDMDPQDPKAVRFVRDGLSTRIRGVMTRGRGREILELFDWLVSKAYGEIEDDGETFLQSEQIFEDWKNTASFKYFFEQLVTDTDLMTEFVNNVFASDLGIKTEKPDPEFASHRKAMRASES